MFSWLVILPPFCVILGAFITRKMVPSFLIGISIAALIATGGSFVEAVQLAAARMWQSSGLAGFGSWDSFINSWNLLIFLFLCTLGILIILLKESGATQAFTNVAQKRVKNKRSAETTSLFLSLFFFIDDYFSALTVGSVMQPLADAVCLSRVKLAFLITAMASPLAVLSPISSWVGEIILQLRQGGIDESNVSSMISADPLTVYLHAIPTIFYALFLIITAWYVVMRKISYGPMTQYDCQVQKITVQGERKNNSATLVDFFIPLVSLIGIIIGGLLFTGNWWVFGGIATLVQAFKSGAINKALFIGGLASLCISIIWLVLRKKILVAQLPSVVYCGIAMMLPSILMLTCAWSLGALLKNDLNTGAFLAQNFSNFMTPLSLPLVSFIISALVAWMIGSAWAAMGLMVPIIFEVLKVVLAIPVHAPLAFVPLIIPTFGAILSGSILGTHCSLLSDTPIMTSTSTGAPHFEHVKTMAWYLIPPVIGAAVGYFTIAYALLYALSLKNSILLAWVAGIACTIISIEIMNKLFKQH